MVTDIKKGDFIRIIDFNTGDSLFIKDKNHENVYLVEKTKFDTWVGIKFIWIKAVPLHKNNDDKENNLFRLNLNQIIKVNTPLHKLKNKYKKIGE